MPKAPRAADIGPLHGAVVAIGNFDGVHRGHRAVIGAALGRAKALGRKAAALTFAPHPRRFLAAAGHSLFQLSNDRDRLRLLAAQRARRRHRHDLRRAARGHLGGAISSSASWSAASASAARRSASTFISATSAPARRPIWPSRARRLGFAVDIVPPLEDEGRPVSSGAVRTALSQGKVVEATELLGAPWFVSGEVIHGAKRGRAARLSHRQHRGSIRPAASSTASMRCAVGVGGKRHDGVANFGVRPMFDGGAPLLEVFLFDFDGDLYGQTLDVASSAGSAARAEIRLGRGADRQIAADSAQARDVLKRAGKASVAVLGEYRHSTVIAGLDPAIHEAARHGEPSKACRLAWRRIIGAQGLARA